MSRYVLKDVLTIFRDKTHGGRIYDEQVFNKEIIKWKIQSRKVKIEKILKFL